MSRAHRRNGKGFSLIEIMMVGAIAALLASIAVPTYQQVGARSKRAERELAMRDLEQAIFVEIGGHDVLPTALGAGVSTLTVGTNPPLPYTALKKQFDTTVPGWNYLVYNPSGGTYYHYSAFVFRSPAVTWFYVAAVGDADGNTILNYKYRYWIKDLQDWRIWVELEWPPNEL